MAADEDQYSGSHNNRNVSSHTLMPQCYAAMTIKKPYLPLKIKLGKGTQNGDCSRDDCAEVRQSSGKTVIHIFSCGGRMDSLGRSRRISPATSCLTVFVAATGSHHSYHHVITYESVISRSELYPARRSSWSCPVTSSSARKMRLHQPCSYSSS